MTEPHSFVLGGIRCSTHTLSDLLREIRFLLDNREARPRVLNFVNAHVFNLASRDAELRRRLDQSRVVVADGMAIVQAARLLNHPLAERCNMTEAFRAFLAEPSMPPSRCLLAGGTAPEAAAAARTIGEASPHCRVVQTLSGYLADDDYRDELAANADADMILVGMGTPRSERVAELAAAACPRAIVWHIGGGTLQFLAGTNREAPGFFRRTGLQWLHRLCREPRRLWRRYLFGNPEFLWRLAREKWRSLRSRKDASP